MKKELNCYEPLYSFLGPELDPNVLFLMYYGLSEEEAKKKISNGWKYPFEEVDDE